MPKKLPPIRLRARDRNELKRLVRSGQSNASTAFRAGIVLMAAEGACNADIARHFKCSPQVVKMWKDRWGAEGIRGLANRKVCFHRGTSPLLRLYLERLERLSVSDGSRALFFCSEFGKQRNDG